MWGDGSRAGGSTLVGEPEFFFFYMLLGESIKNRNYFIVNANPVSP